MKFRYVIVALILISLLAAEDSFCSTEVIDTISVYAYITPSEAPPKRYNAKSYSELQVLQAKNEVKDWNKSFDLNVTKQKNKSLSDEEKKEIEQAYLEVLNGRKDFYPKGVYDSGLYIYPVNIRNFKNVNGMYFSPCTIGFVDFDNDGSREVVLTVRAGKMIARKLVLHYYDGKVYGFLIPYDEMKELRTDGLFQNVKNDEYDAYYNLMFQKNDATVTEICSIHYNDQYGNIYMFNDEVVNKDIYDMGINNITTEKVKYYSFDRHEWREDLFSE